MTVAQEQAQKEYLATKELVDEKQLNKRIAIFEELYESFEKRQKEANKLVEQKAKSYGINQIYLWTEGEKPFYLKRGYKEVEQLIKPGRVIDVLTKSFTDL